MLQKWRVVAYAKENTVAEAARKFHVADSTVRGWMKIDFEEAIIERVREFWSCELLEKINTLGLDRELKELLSAPKCTSRIIRVTNYFNQYGTLHEQLHWDTL